MFLIFTTARTNCNPRQQFNKTTRIMGKQGFIGNRQTHFNHLGH